MIENCKYFVTLKLYKNLNIITNKATDQEMKNIKHHLIGYLNSDCITNTVIDYRNKAVKLVSLKKKPLDEF
jgi:tRNA A37 N6-isopentenylltransferase MiaA